MKQFILLLLSLICCTHLRAATIHDNQLTLGKNDGQNVVFTLNGDGGMRYNYAAGRLEFSNDGGVSWYVVSDGTGGSIFGPASSTTNAVPRWGNAGGSALLDSSVLIDNSGNVSGINDLDVAGTTTLDTSLTGPLKAAAGVVSAGDIDLTSEVVGVLPIANGGTGSSAGLSNDLVMVSDSGAIVESTVATSELEALAGISSNVQDQLDGKLATSVFSAKGDILVYDGTSPDVLAACLDGETLIANSGEPLGWSCGEGGGGASDAVDVAYDNQATGLEATDVQAAIDEIDWKIGVVENSMSNIDVLAAKGDILAFTGSAYGALTACADGEVYLADSTEDLGWKCGTAGSGSGDVSGPGSSQNTAIAVWDGVDGDKLASSPVLVSPDGDVNNIRDIEVTGTATIGSLDGVVKASSGVISAGSVDLTTDVSDVLPVENGGTNSGTALTNNKVMISYGDAIVESAIDPSELALTAYVDAQDENYIKGDNSNFNYGLGAWTAYNDANGGIYDFVDGTGGTPANLTCVSSTDFPIENPASMSCNTNSNGAGEGRSLDVTLQQFLVKKNLEVCFETANRLGAGGNWQFVIYNKDSSAVEYKFDIPAASENITSSRKYCIPFYSNSANYRFAFHSKEPMTLQITRFDKFDLREQKTIDIASSYNADIVCSSTSSIADDPQGLLQSVGDISSGACALSWKSTARLGPSPKCQVTSSESISDLMAFGIYDADNTGAILRCKTESGADCTGPISVNISCPSADVATVFGQQGKGPIEFEAKSTTNQTIGNSTVTINFPTVDKALGASYLDGVVTFAESGKVDISPYVRLGDGTNYGVVTISIQINRGSVYTALRECAISVNADQNRYIPLVCPVKTEVRVGDLLRIRATGSTTTVVAQGGSSLHIKRYSDGTEPIVGIFDSSQIKNACFPHTYSETEIKCGIRNGEQLYRRCFTVPANITTSSNVVTWDTGLRPVNSIKYSSNHWKIQDVYDGTNRAILHYNESSGVVRAGIADSSLVGAGTTFCMDYTK